MVLPTYSSAVYSFWLNSSLNRSLAPPQLLWCPWKRQSRALCSNLPLFFPQDMHVISTDENQVFAAVQEWNQNDTYNLYISDTRGVYFTLALENVKSSQGLEGNVMIDLYEVCHVSKHLIPVSGGHMMPVLFPSCTSVLLYACEQQSQKMTKCIVLLLFHLRDSVQSAELRRLGFTWGLNSGSA